MLHSRIFYLSSCSYCTSLAVRVCCVTVQCCVLQKCMCCSCIFMLCDITVDYSCKVALVRSLSAGGE